MSDLTIILNAEPYFYNCRRCGNPIFDKTVETTEIARKRGTCDRCARKIMQKVIGGDILVVELPKQSARWN